MKVEVNFQNLEDEIKSIANRVIQESILNGQNAIGNVKEWLNIKEGAEYAGVSYNTFMKFREMGLEFLEIDGVKRVSKKSINEFYKKYTY